MTEASAAYRRDNPGMPPIVPKRETEPAGRSGSKCATIGCTDPATERISYSYQGDSEPAADDVCGPCADGYQRRPALVGFARAPIAPEAAPLTGAARFFWEHAGYSYPSGATQAEQELARREQALELASAERLAKGTGAWFRWELEPEGDANGDHPSYVAQLYRYGPNGETAQMLAVMGGIDSEPGSDCARVVQAQLAQQSLSELEPDREAELVLKPVSGNQAGRLTSRSARARKTTPANDRRSDHERRANGGMPVPERASRQLQRRQPEVRRDDQAGSDAEPAR